MANVFILQPPKSSITFQSIIAHREKAVKEGRKEDQRKQGFTVFGKLIPGCLVTLAGFQSRKIERASEKGKEKRRNREGMGFEKR